MHEEDYGILWKHVDQRGGTDEVRRSRRLVVSFVATVGNYEYGFYWYFYLDGNIQLEVKLTGIVSTMAITPGDATRVRQRDRARARGRRTTSTCSPRGSTSTSTAPPTACTRSRRNPCRRAPRIRGATRSRRSRRRLDTELGAAARDQRGDEPRVEDRQSRRA